jgi:CBS-domain-containing membrane protein
VEPKTPLATAITIMASGVHRLIITDSSALEPLVGIVSQMDICRFLYKRWNLIPSVLHTMQMENIMTRNILSVSPKGTILSAIVFVISLHRKCP